MSEKKRTNDGQRPIHEGFQPGNNKGFQPTPGRVTGGHQPTTSEQKPTNPQQPPKKP